MSDDPIPREELLAVWRGEQTVQGLCRRLGVEEGQYRAAAEALLRRKFYTPSQTLPLKGLHGRARIARDGWGVPHCFAEDAEDLYFAVGLAQAQDRLWQMDYRRRFVCGELAEVLGRRALDTDREHLTLGFRRIVEAVELPALGREARAVLNAYSAGVNAWIEASADELPVEFDILQYTPKPWTPVDSLAILRHFWWTLTGRLGQLVSAERLLRSTSPQVSEWFLRPETVSFITGGEGEALGGGFGQTPGSNNWAVGADLSTGGAPVMAADPHWPLAFPDMWYEQRVCGAGMDCIGPAYPGVPPVVFGRTPGFSWGRTNNVTSTRDLYHERLHPDDTGLHWDGAGWVPFAEETHSIAVRGEAAYRHTVRRSCHGPLVNEFIPSISPAGDGPVSLRWVGQERIGDVESLLDLARCQSVEAGLQVFGGWRMSVWNAVMADSNGDFAYQMVGSIPQRGVRTRGTRPAFEEGHEWEGYTGSGELPGLRRPQRGWVASANNPPSPLLYGTYADGYRYDRIAEVLGAAGPLSPAEIGALQNDTLSLQALDLKEHIAGLLQETGQGDMAEIAAVLRDWDARFDLGQTGATLWAALWPRLVQRVGAAVLEPFVAELNVGNAGRLTRHLLLDEGPDFFKADLKELLAAAAVEALAYLRDALGEDWRGWTWGQAHCCRLRHPLATNPEAERILNPAVIACPGGPGVINNRSAVQLDTGFELSGGPSYWLVADMSDIDATQGCLLAGQVALPGHAHYADQLSLWPIGGRHPLPLAAEVVERSIVGETVLEPV
jgi:penicillin G amidase